jgi:N-acetylornithine carbamoyltransferase
MPRHFLAPTDLSAAETESVLALAAELKRAPVRRDLAGKSVALVFFNPSLRTRVSFEVGISQLGGIPTVIDVGSSSWKLEYRDSVVMDGDAVEHIREAAPVLCRFADAVAVRAFPERKSWEHDRTDPVISAFARCATKPIINMESSMHHPCQALADLMTIRERIGRTKGEPIVVTWAWHPHASPMAVTNSILLEAAKAGMEIRLAHPEGWELDEDVLAATRRLAAAAGGGLSVHHDLASALPGARVVYAKEYGAIANYGDIGKERMAKAALRDKWRISMEHLDQTDSAFFMHCLPVRRNVVVDEEVLDSGRNAAIDEAENRLHVQKALLLKLLGSA